MQIHLFNIINRMKCSFIYVLIEVEWNYFGLQHSLKNVKVISSSRAYLLLRDQLEKSKSMVLHYRALFEKLQVVTSW